MVAQTGVEMRSHGRQGGLVGRREVEVAREPGDGAGEVVEQVGVADQQMTGVVGDRREQVAQPETRGLRGAHGIAAHRE